VPRESVYQCFVSTVVFSDTNAHSVAAARQRDANLVERKAVYLVSPGLSYFLPCELFLDSFAAPILLSDAVVVA
jgi:hypothetical protein